ncbi:MAG TPA: hypothetical protein VF520_11390 [Thermoleophilaceae bacterium]
MARVLIVGCGCRGAALGQALRDAGHAVRATTRRPERAEDLAALGLEPAVADPDRLGTLLPHLQGTSVLCWLMASATGEAEAVAALHGPRLESLLATLVDTHVRGFVYEAAGSAPRGLLEDGARLVARAAAAHRIGAATVEADPSPAGTWVEAARAAVDVALAG